jgi:hypothetical protein
MKNKPSSHVPQRSRFTLRSCHSRVRWVRIVEHLLLEGITCAMKTRHFLFAIVIWVILLFGQSGSVAGEAKEMGTPEAPPDAQTVAGSYYRGDGTGYNIYLTLKADGKYTAEWHGCLGKYGAASGRWRLKDKSITFKPSKEEGMMQGHLKTLNVFKFKGRWIFVPTDDREFYDKWGVSRYSCYQKRDEK